MADSLNFNQNTSATNEGFANHPYVSESKDLASGTAQKWWSRLTSGLSGARSYGTNAVSAVNTHAHANPWLHIAAVGAGAFAAGYFLARSRAIPVDGIIEYSYSDDLEAIDE